MSSGAPWCPASTFAGSPMSPRAPSCPVARSTIRATSGRCGCAALAIVGLLARHPRHGARGAVTARVALVWPRCSSVLVSTCSTCSSVMVRGRPGRRPRLVRQPLQPIDQKPRAPLRHRSARQLQFLRHLRDGPALSTRQHDPRPQRQRLRRLPPPRPPHQHRTFLAGQHHWIKLRLGITRVY